MRQRVLILHADIYSSPGREAAHYFRIVERNPAIDFHYPSVGRDLAPDVRRELPSNAFPFICSTHLDIGPSLGDLRRLQWIDRHYASVIARVAAAVQGMVLSAVDLPSSFPVCHLIRPVFSAFGVVVEKIAMGLVGSPSRYLTVAGQAEPDRAILDAFKRAEEAAAAAADVRYSFSGSARATENRLNHPISVIDPHDLISSLPPPPLSLPGRGKPDLWYVGPLDEAKAPELFIELAVGIGRHCYHSLCFAGENSRLPGNARRSERLIDLAQRKGVTVHYVGNMPRKELREKFANGRLVVVAMPSCFDPFCFAAIDAIRSGCPVLLSERTDGFQFLKANHPEHLPSPMDPDNVASAIPTLRHLMENYPQVAKARRRALRNHPFPVARVGFMENIYESPVKRGKGASSRTRGLTTAISAGLPLLSAPIREWRPRRVSSASCVSVVIPTRDRPEELARTLTNLVHVDRPGLETVVVVDMGSMHSSRTHTVVESFAPLARLMKVGRSEEAIAINLGLEATRGEFVCIVADTDRLCPDLTGAAVETLKTHPEAVGVYPDWGLLDGEGTPLESKNLPEFDRELMIQAHWCIPGPGTIVRRAAVENVGGLDATFRFLSIYDLWLRMTRAGPLLRIAQRLAYAIRKHSSAVSDRDRASLADEHLRVIERQYDNREMPGHFEDKRAMAMAAAHMTAAAVLGTVAAPVAIDHLIKANRSDSSLFDALPPNLRELAGEWPQNWRTAVPLVSAS